MTFQTSYVHACVPMYAHNVIAKGGTNLLKASQEKT